jgi:hypothetical protein
MAGLVPATTHHNNMQRWSGNDSPRLHPERFIINLQEQRPH